MRQLNEIAVSSSDLSSANGSAIVSGYLLQLSAQAVVTGSSPVGTLKVQCSNDSPGIVGGPVNWSDISGATVSVTGTGSFLIPKIDICYQWIRLVWTKTSGTGAVTVRLQAIGE
jgi:hypothetical protein